MENARATGVLARSSALSEDELSDLEELSDLHQASAVLTYVQHSTLYGNRNRNQKSDNNSIVNSTHKALREHLANLPQRMFNMLTRMSNNLNCYHPPTADTALDNDSNASPRAPNSF